MIGRELDPGPAEVDAAFYGGDPEDVVDGDVGCGDTELERRESALVWAQAIFISG